MVNGFQHLQIVASKIKQSPRFIFLLCAFYFVMLALSLDWVYGPVLPYITLSDLIYVESLYRDIFIRDFPLNGWLVTRAPFFFPDWILYFLIRAITGNYGAAWYLYVIFDFGFLLLLFYGFIRLFYKKKPCMDLLYAICWGAILVLLLKLAPRDYGPHTLLLPVYHSGALISGLLIFLIWNHALITSLNYKNLLFLSFLCCITTISDEWWIIWFGIPIGLTTLLLMAFKRVAWRTNIIFLSALSTGIIAGKLIIQLVKIKKWLYFSQIQLGTQNSSLLNQLYNIQRDLIELLSSSPPLFILFIACLWLCISTITSWNHSKKTEKTFLTQQETTSFVAMHIAVLFSFIMPFIFISFLGMWEKWNYRYIPHLIILPWMIVGLHLLNLQRTDNKIYYKLTYLFPLILCLPLLFFASNSSCGNSRRGISTITETPYIQLAACVDQVTLAHNIKYGISEYWNAKNITETSQTGIFINQFTYDFDVLHWINNLNWYFDPTKKGKEFVNYDFIVAPFSKQSLEKVQTLFGKPTEINFCAGNAVLIYKDHNKKYLNDAIQYKTKTFFSRLGDISILGENTLHDETINSAVNTNWEYFPVTDALFQKTLFNKTNKPSDINSTYYSHWQLSKPTSFAFVEKKFNDLNTLTGKYLVLTFWAKSLSGEKTLSSHIYLAPNGILDNSAIFIHPVQGEHFTLDGTWKKITVIYDIPRFPNMKISQHSYALIRPLFIENSQNVTTIDIANIQLFSLSNPALSNNSYFHFVNHDSDLLKLIALADQYHLASQFKEEFKFLKKAEAAILYNTESATKLIANVNPSLKAEIFWRLARIHYHFADTTSSEVHKSHIYTAAQYASSAHYSHATTNTAKWLAISSAEIGKIEGVRQKNIMANNFHDLIQQAIVANPSKAELYALLGEWNYEWAHVDFLSRLKSAILFSPTPKASIANAQKYFSRAVELEPKNKLYQTWLAKTKE